MDSEPPLEEFEDFYLRAYWNLYSEKGGGPAILWSKIIEYGERSGLDSAMIEVLVRVIRQLENKHVSWINGERQRRELVDKPSPAQRAKSMSRKTRG